MVVVEELLALLMLVIVEIFFYEKHRVEKIPAKLFRGYLTLAEVSVFLKLLAELLNQYLENQPKGLAVLLNTFYFLVSIWAATCLSFYLLYRIMEFAQDAHVMGQGLAFLGILNLAYFLFLMLNLRSGWVFWIENQYHRGQWHACGYLAMALEWAMVLGFTLRYKSKISKVVKRALWLILLVAPILGGLQLLFPEAVLSGWLLVFAAVIVMLNFQVRKVCEDPVTGLGTRGSLVEELRLQLKSGEYFQVLMVTVENLEQINKEYGYEMGDNTLYRMASWLEDREISARIFRLYENCFVAVCPFDKVEETKTRFQEYEERFAEPWEIMEQKIVVSASVFELICKGDGWRPYQVIEYLERRRVDGKRAED